MWSDIDKSEKRNRLTEMKETVETLRKQGFKVAVFHRRRYNHKLVQPLLPYGGKTEVVVTDLEGNTATGKARCSKEDAYCKKTGVRIALDRALQKLAKKEFDICDNRAIVLQIDGNRFDLSVKEAEYVIQILQNSINQLNEFPLTGSVPQGARDPIEELSDYLWKVFRG